jgi:hypothetical protein
MAFEGILSGSRFPEPCGVMLFRKNYRHRGWICATSSLGSPVINRASAYPKTRPASFLASPILIRSALALQFHFLKLAKSIPEFPQSDDHLYAIRSLVTTVAKLPLITFSKGGSLSK